MWVFTSAGIFSIVQKYNKKDTYQVRGRVKQDFENLKKLVPSLADKPILDHVGTDYEYRIYCTKEQVHDIMNKIVDGIDYSNFKDKIHEVESNDLRENALMDIWSILLHLGRDIEDRNYPKV